MNIRIVFIALVMIILPVLFLHFYSSYYAQKFHAKERAFHSKMLDMLNGEKEKSFSVSELFNVKSGEFICLVSGWDNQGKVVRPGDYTALGRAGLTKADIR